MALFDKFIIFSELAGVFAALVVVVCRNRIVIKDAYIFFGLWTLICLFEYYFLGSNSYVHMDEEGDLYPPYYLYLLSQHLGGQFGHSISSGSDVYTALSPNIQLISPELIWFRLFPIWIAILLHKFIVVTVGYLGSYWLCRYTTKADVLICAAAAALFTVSTHNLVIVTYSVGAGLSFLPLAIYTMVARSKEPKYWRYAVPTAVGAAIYLDPTHNAETLFVGLAFAAILLNRINLRLAALLLILFCALIINWGESLYAMLQISPFTFRGDTIAPQADLLSEFMKTIRQFPNYAFNEHHISIISIVAVGILWWTRDPLRHRASVAVFGVMATYMTLLLFPFEKIGLGFLKNLSHHYVLLALTGLTLTPLAQAASQLQAYLLKSKRVAADSNLAGILILATAVGSLTYFKSYNFGSFIYHGGQSQYRTIDTVLSTEWRPDAAFRVMTLRVRDLGPEPGLALGSFNLEPIDQFLMLRPKQMTAFIGNGIRKSDNFAASQDSRMFVDWKRWKDKKYHGVGEQFSLDLLRLVNVGFILSPIPFADDSGLKLVAKPAHPPITRFERSANLWAYIKERVERIFDFTDLYVYALPSPYPQIFTPTALRSVPDGLSANEFIEVLKVAAKAPGQTAVAEQKVMPILGKTNTSFKVDHYERITDGYAINVRAPEGGIVVVNTQHMPFWSATADGQAVDVVPINFIQMAARIPAGTHNILFKYHRPDIADLFKKVMH